MREFPIVEVGRGVGVGVGVAIRYDAHLGRAAGELHYSSQDWHTSHVISSGGAVPGLMAYYPRWVGLGSTREVGWTWMQQFAARAEANRDSRTADGRQPGQQMKQQTLTGWRKTKGWAARSADLDIESLAVLTI